MRELLILVVIVAVIAIIVYLRRQSAKAAEQRKIDEFRRLQSAAAAQDQAALATESVAAATAIRADTARPAGRAEGLLQEAADVASGKEYEQATGELDAMTAELAAARRDADRAAARLTGQASEAMASIQAAAAAHGGAVPGDGTHNCPSSYPIKGNMPTMLYHEQGQPSYARTIPEVCFQTVAAAEAAGFTAARDEGGYHGAQVLAGEAIVAEEVVAVQDGDQVDVVAAAIAAADAGGVPPGAVRGDGSRECPPVYPIKGNQSAMVYHVPGSPTYQSTIAELCFSSVESAEAAGFRATKH
jgi:hypothetical protein